VSPNARCSPSRQSRINPVTTRVRRPRTAPPEPPSAG
jgi:hypothetical protein